ncbi:MAG TPA: Lrp/AsnC family transcriptional regulator [Methanocella sp.]|nr:Lrp/AsnC family transcriptional regulator [Methanocella sp.]
MRDTDIDIIDKKILSMLSQDANIPHAEMAEVCGITRQTIASRIHRMERGGVIKGYRTIIDMEKVGLRAFFVLFLKLDVTDQTTIEDFVRTLKGDPHVITDVSITGEWDVMLLLAFMDVREYESYISQLRLEMGQVLRDSKSHVILNFYKSPDDWVPFRE